MAKFGQNDSSSLHSTPSAPKATGGSPYSPLFLNLKGREVVVVGGGSVAYTKIKHLLPSGARITVVSPELSEPCQAWHDSALMRWLSRPYTPGDLAGATLAFATTSDPAVNRQILEEGRSLHVPVNLCDAWESGDFINGAWLYREPLSVSVSTTGAHPSAARMIRDYFGEDPTLASAILLIKAMRRKRNEGKRDTPKMRQLLAELLGLLHCRPQKGD